MGNKKTTKKDDGIIVEIEEVKGEKPQVKHAEPKAVPTTTHKSVKAVQRVLVAIDMFVKVNRNSRNYALLAGFEHQERKNKRLRDTKENYVARLEEYKTK